MSAIRPPSVGIVEPSPPTTRPSPRTLKPGTLPEFLRLSAEIGRPIRGDRYGTLVGSWTTELGGLNRYVHLWTYGSLDERERLRTEMGQNCPT